MADHYGNIHTGIDAVTQLQDALDTPETVPVTPTPAAAPDDPSSQEITDIDDLDGIEFLIEEIEDQIAPLAL